MRDQGVGETGRLETAFRLHPSYTFHWLVMINYFALNLAAETVIQMSKKKPTYNVLNIIYNKTKKIYIKNIQATKRKTISQKKTVSVSFKKKILILMFSST